MGIHGHGVFEMGNSTRTTETLRETLFDTIENLVAGRTGPKEAAQVANLADKIIKTADLEIKYAEKLAALDAGDTGVSPGPMLLTQKKEIQDDR
jgi:hypothetical protein